MIPHGSTTMKPVKERKVISSIIIMMYSEFAQLKKLKILRMLQKFVSIQKQEGALLL